MISTTGQYKMLGTYRYFLAICVVISHTAPLQQSHLGYYAVLSFFMLSGFLLCKSLRNDYFHQKTGWRIYLTNRILRVYPLYLIVVITTLYMFEFLPQNPETIHHKLGLPATVYEWIINFTIIGNTSLLGVRSENFFIPASWSLCIELCFWLVMIGLCKHQIVIKYWCILSVIIYLSIIASGALLSLRYYSIFAGSCAFSIGAWAALRFSCNQYVFSSQKRLAYILCILIFYFSSVCLYVDSSIRMVVLLLPGLPLSMVISYMIITYLVQLNTHSFPEYIIKFDRMLGDLSYPVFISHIAVLYFMIYVGVVSVDDHRTWVCCLVTVILTTLFSILFVYAVERPIEKIRLHMKLRLKSSTPSL